MRAEHIDDVSAELLYSASGHGTDWGMAHVIAALAEAEQSDDRRAKRLRRAAKSRTLRLLRTARREDAGAAWRARNRSDLLQAKWGVDFHQPRATLLKLKSLPAVDLIDRDLREWLMAKSRETDLAPDVWRREQVFGALADLYFRDLTDTMTAEDVEQGATGEKIKALFDVVDVPSIEQVRKSWDRSSGLLALNIHAGPFRLGRWLRNRYAFDNQLFAIGAGGDRSSESYASVTDDPVKAMMMLVKHLRSPGTVGGVAVDGNKAGSEAEVVVLGKPVGLALGPPHILYHSRCRGALFQYYWKDEKVSMRMQQGPRPHPQEPIGAWTRRWFDWLMPHIEQVVTGPPKNIRGSSGIWSKLAGTD